MSFQMRTFTLGMQDWHLSNACSAIISQRTDRVMGQKSKFVVLCFGYNEGHQEEIKTVRNFVSLFALCGVLALPAVSQAQTKTKITPNTQSKIENQKSKISVSAVKLAYDLKPRSTFRYRVTGLFNGHFPPFATPGGPAINLRVVIEYAGKVTKADANGVEVVFEVDKGDLYILQREPGADGKVNPDEEIAFPIALSTVQKALNVTAVVRPDGSIVSLKTDDAAPIPISLGIDLRKLFLLTMPVTFPDKSLKAGEQWKFTDGLLGQNPGSTAYTGTLEGVKSLTGGGIASNVSLSASSKINEKKTKDGKLTDKPEEAVETSVGEATVTGAMTYSGTVPNAMRLKQGKLMLTAKVARTAPDPEKPTEKLTTPSDVKARLTVQQLATKPAAKKTAAATKENARR
jgi:hypothetical protein